VGKRLQITQTQNTRTCTRTHTTDTHTHTLHTHDSPPTPPAPRSKYSVQTFNATANQATSSLLFLSAIGIVLPTAATSFGAEMGAQQILEISRGTAIVLLGVYACYLARPLLSPPFPTCLAR
jgi:hypothetical protein